MDPICASLLLPADPPSRCREPPNDGPVLTREGI